MRYEVKSPHGKYYTHSWVQAKKMAVLWCNKYGLATIADLTRVRDIDSSVKEWVKNTRPSYEIIDIQGNVVTFEHDGYLSAVHAISNDLDAIYDQIERYLYSLATWTNS